MNKKLKLKKEMIASLTDGKLRTINAGGIGFYAGIDGRTKGVPFTCKYCSNCISIDLPGNCTPTNIPEICKLKNMSKTKCKTMDCITNENSICESICMPCI